MLEARSKGIRIATIIEQMAPKYGVSERCLWTDWMRKDTWVQGLLDLEKYASFTDMLALNANAILTAAWQVLYNADGDNAKVGALNVLCRIVEDQEDTFKDREDREVRERLESLEEKFEKKSERKKP